MCRMACRLSVLWSCTQETVYLLFGRHFLNPLSLSRSLTHTHTITSKLLVVILSVLAMSEASYILCILLEIHVKSMFETKMVGNFLKIHWYKKIHSELPHDIS